MRESNWIIFPGVKRKKNEITTLTCIKLKLQNVATSFPKVFSGKQHTMGYWMILARKIEPKVFKYNPPLDPKTHRKMKVLGPQYLGYNP